MGALWSFFRSARANAMVEFCLVLPLMVLAPAGIVEFGRIFVISDQVNRMASQYAIAWADCTDAPVGTCSTEMTNLASSYTIGNIFPQLQSANITLQMFQIDMVASTSGSAANPTLIYAYPSGATMSAAQLALAKSFFQSGQTGVIVTASYQLSLLFFPTLMTPFLSRALTPNYTVAQLRAGAG